MFVFCCSPSSLWMRKWFHLLALAVYLPGIALDPTLLSIASALVTVVFMTIEVCVSHCSLILSLSRFLSLSLSLCLSLSLSLSLSTTHFLYQLIRLFRIWPLGEPLHQLLIPFTDSRDSGILIVTHTYLLLGFSLPVWLYPLKDIHTVKHSTHILLFLKHYYHC